MKQNKPVFSFAFVAYPDGSHNESVKMEEGGEKVAASVVFTMMNGQMAAVVSELLKESHPDSHEEITNIVSALYDDFAKQAKELIKNAPQRPVIRSTEVFGGKQE
jgi:hypothetical protein